MKGKNLVSLVLSLDHEEYEFVHRAIAGNAENKAMLDLFVAIRNSDKYNRKALSQSTGLKETRVRDLLPVLSKAVTLALGNHRPDQPLELDIQLAAVWKLVFRIQNGPAEEVMQDLYDKATAVDRFDILYEILKLAEIMTVPAEIIGLSKKELTEKHLNLLQYQEMKVKADKLTTMPSGERLKLASELADSELMQSIQEAKSVSALAHYYWVWKRIHYVREDHASTYRHQQKLIDLLEENRWLDRYEDFFFAREHRPLVVLLIAQNKRTEAHQQIFKVGNFETYSPLSTKAKWEQLFPLKTIMAIDEGNVKVGMEAIGEFNRLVDGNKKHLPDRFLTQNHYYNAYFLFSIGEYQQAQKSVLRLSQFKNAVSFIPAILAMSRILETFLAFELGDLVEMGRQDKNFRMTNAYLEANYFKFALGVLKKMSGKKDRTKELRTIEKALIKFPELYDDAYSVTLIRRFNLEVWLESKRAKCTMSEIFKHRASILEKRTESGLN